MEEENEGSKVVLDRVGTSAISVSLTVPTPLDSLYSESTVLIHPPLSDAYEALAHGKLHNSWPCYTPTVASPRRRTRFQRAAAIRPLLHTTIARLPRFNLLPC